MNDEDIKNHYALALKIIAESAPETDSVEDLKQWYGSVRLLANNALLQNSLDCEWEEALKTSSKSRANVGRSVRLKQ